MKLFRLPSLALSLLLQLLPILRVATADAALVVSPVMAVLRLIAGASAMAGSYHAVSGASVTLNNPAAGKVRATNGVPSPFRVEMTYSDGIKNLTPSVYDAKNLPPGFNQPTKSGAIWRITGTPTQSGVFTTVKVTGYEKDRQDRRSQVYLNHHDNGCGCSSTDHQSTRPERDRRGRDWSHAHRGGFRGKSGYTSG